MSTEAKKVAKFQRELRAAFLYALGGAQSVAYATVVQQAYAIERDRKEWKVAQDAKKGAGTSQGTSNSKNKKWIVKLENNKANNPQCNQCGKKHDESCLVEHNK